jgi:hypothetical protein
MSAYQDLLKDTSVAVENGNYFIVTITDLELNTNYPVQLRWKYKDGTYGLWSASKVLTTPGETLPGTPDLPVGSVTTEPGLIKITWNGNDAAGRAITNIDRIDIYIDGSPFDGSKPAGSFKSAGTQTIAAPAGEYAVALYAISNYGSKSAVSLPRTVIVSAVGEVVLSPEDPDVPIITAGLASVIVEWNGKRLDSNGDPVDFTKGSFAGAKVFIGTTSNFTPSNDNWVHTLNFANGSNKVSIGVGTIINKSTGATLQYGVPYYIKIDTINASGVANGQPVSADGNPITVSKLPASEISTGTLTADNSITAGVSSGQRVVISGSSSPFIIYGTDGTTKLLEYLTSGTTGTLAIKGSGTFTGSLEIGSDNTVFKAVPATGIWLGHANYASAPFRVSNSGFLTATYGDIGGWSLGESYLQNSTGSLKINSGTDPNIFLGSSSGYHFRLTPSSISHYNGGSPTGKFTLTASPGAGDSHLSMSGNITGSTITGSSFTLQEGGLYNIWNSTKFIIGDANSFISTDYGSGTITMFSGQLPADITGGEEDGSGYNGYLSESQIVLGAQTISQVVGNSVKGVRIYNIPTLGNYVTATGSLLNGSSGAPSTNITQYANYDATKGYGAAARQRMVVADPYNDNMLKRGLGVYYGTRTSVPTASTGVVGDLWVSWA